MAVYRNIGGTWHSALAWRKIGGTWKLCSLWRKIGGTWKLLTVLFTPDGGDLYSGVIRPVTASVTLNCSIPAVWSFTLPGGVTATSANGASATSIMFSRSAVGDVSFGVTGTANGVTRVFTIELDVEP